ncbi:MAG: MAPEG family protein [Novosphingobium sp.]|uniref:MAPEG family protein n=1 Tax=Novosphingobium sp. TaxID=1874826 RepID=UPI0030195A7E
MTLDFELKATIAATIWGFVQLVAAAQSANWQYGLRWAASPRDEVMPELGVVPGRLGRNFRNYMETFPFFVAGVAVIELAGVHGALTRGAVIAYLAGRLGYSVLYVWGVPLVRSLFWNIATFGIFGLLVSPFV